MLPNRGSVTSRLDAAQPGQERLLRLTAEGSPCQGQVTRRIVDGPATEVDHCAQAAVRAQEVEGTDIAVDPNGGTALESARAAKGVPSRPEPHNPLRSSLSLIG